MSHRFGSPEPYPVVNHLSLCADEPCVQVSGFTWPRVADWIRSSPTEAAALSASRTSDGVMFVR